MMSKKAIKKAKRAEFFSLKEYLYKKAQLRALKLQFRQARRNAKKEGVQLTLADYMASLPSSQPHTHEHSDEPLVVDEDNLTAPVE